MKNSAAEKDEKWLQNFLSESLVDDIPWECSKALIILKEGYQAIIPREASRYVLPVSCLFTSGLTGIQLMHFRFNILRIKTLTLIFPKFLGVFYLEKLVTHLLMTMEWNSTYHQRTK